MGRLPLGVGDRVLTDDLRLGTIVSMRRTLDRVRGGSALRGEWYAVVKLDGGGSQMQWLRNLAPAEQVEARDP